MTPIVALGRALFGERWQAPLARALDMTPATMSDWARGASEPRASTRQALLSLARRRRTDLDAAIRDFEASPPPRDGRAPKLSGDALERARALWRDPAMSADEVAEAVGLHRTNLHRLFGVRR